MATPSDITRYRRNLREERDAVVLYERMARAEPNPALAELYGRLAGTERKHAAVWEEKLRQAGVEVPDHRSNWRMQVLGWLAGHFGAKLVLPTIAGIESTAGAQYDGQADAESAGMPAEERSHARLFGFLSRQTSGVEGSVVARLEGRHRSTGGNALRAGVLGANDGLVSVFSLVMGMAGAEVGSHVVLITGLAGLLAGAISMALGEWLSVQSSRELHEHQVGVEREELATAPEEEREELTLIYQAKGVAPDQARALADRLLSDPATALDTLTREELGLDPREMGGSAWEAAITSFLLFTVGAIIPVLPFFATGGLHAVIWSCILSAAGLFVIGAAITLVTGRHALWSGLRQVVFGLAAAAVTFGIGRLLGVNISG
ncbi:MAG: VIT1/CCC1 transporter family protein [Verrucomicrobiota bacterium]